MPTHLPHRRRAPPKPAMPAAPVLASAWLAGLILLAAALGGGTHGPRAAPASPAIPAAGPDAAAVQDMLGHD